MCVCVQGKLTCVCVCLCVCVQGKLTCMCVCVRARKTVLHVHQQMLFVPADQPLCRVTERGCGCPTPSPRRPGNAASGRHCCTCLLKLQVGAFPAVLSFLVVTSPLR